MQTFRVMLGLLLLTIAQVTTINTGYSKTTSASEKTITKLTNATIMHRRLLLVDKAPQLVGSSRDAIHELFGPPDSIENVDFESYSLSSSQLQPLVREKKVQAALPEKSLDLVYKDDRLSKYRVTSRQTQSSDAVEGEWSSASGPLIWTNMFPSSDFQPFLGDKSFDQQKWLSHPNARPSMLRDLTTKYVLVGLPAKKVETLLGRSDWSYKSDGIPLKSYAMNESSCTTGGTKRLDLLFENGVVTAVRLCVHSFQNPWREEGDWIGGCE